MTDYLDVCDVGDVPNGKHRSFVVAGRSILIFQINSEFFAIENRCTHLDYPLNEGRQIGYRIICRAHGASFDVRTGQVLGGPAIQPVSRFDVRTRDGRVEIRIG